MDMVKTRRVSGEKVSLATGIAFIAIALAKLPKMAPTLCMSNPWAPINAALFPVELGLGWAMLKPGRRRRIGAWLGAAVAAGAALALSVIRFAGVSVRGCGCFGPVELGYDAHMLVCAALFLGCVVALRAEHGRLRACDPARTARVFD